MRLLLCKVILIGVISIANQERTRSVSDIDSVIQLNNSILSHDYVLIAFVSTQCSKSRAIKPNLEWAANRIGEEKLPVHVVRLDVDLLNETAPVKELFGIGETPTLKWATRGNVSGYHGEFSANGIFDWVQRFIAHQDFPASWQNCDACRTSLEVMHLIWDELVAAFVSAGQVEEGQPARLARDSASVQAAMEGLCHHRRMQGMDGAVRRGCEVLMRWHGRELASRQFQLFASWCGRSSHSGRPIPPAELRDCAAQWARKVPDGRLGLHDKTAAVCAPHAHAPVAPVCPAPEPAAWARGPAGAGGVSGCAACRGVVDDAAFALRRSPLASLSPSALRRRRADVSELLEGLCAWAHNRHPGDATEGPARAFGRACGELMDDSDDALLDALVRHAAAAGRAGLAPGPGLAGLHRAVCHDIAGKCSLAELGAAAQPVPPAAPAADGGREL